MNSENLNGRTALVTGAGSGIGRAIAQVLGAAGAKVAAADVNFQGAEETAAEARADGAEVSAFASDVTDVDSVAGLREEIESTYGTVDIVVNSAGMSTAQSFLETVPETWWQLVQVNFLGPVSIAREFLPPLVEQERPGVIVNVASDAGRVGSSGETVYAGAKGGLIAFSKSLAREMARHAITVNCVSPGPTDTPMLRAQPQKLQEALVRAVPLRRLGSPLDIAAAVHFLASPEASYITGQVLSVSGGLTMVD